MGQLWAFFIIPNNSDSAADSAFGHGDKRVIHQVHVAAIELYLGLGIFEGHIGIVVEVDIFRSDTFRVRVVTDKNGLARELTFNAFGASYSRHSTGISHADVVPPNYILIFA